MKTRTARRLFLAVHGLLALGILLFPLYRWIMEQVPIGLSGCFLHDRFLLYCSVCGGTRAIEALLSLRLLDALGYNAYVTVAILAALVLDGIAWIRFFKHERPLFRIHPAFWIVMAALLVVYTILRNVLMIFCGIDPMHDLVRFWNAWRG